MRRIPLRPEGENAHLFRSAYSLIFATLVTGALGIAFWILAARLVSPGELGRDSALIAVMGSLTVIAQLNLENTFPRFLPQAERPGRMILKGYAAATAVAVVAAVIAIVIAGGVSDDLAVLRHDPVVAAVWIAGVVLYGLFALEDAVLVGLRAAPWIAVENTVYGVLKLAVLPLLVVAGMTAPVFLAWVLPLVVVVAAVSAVIFGRAIPRHTPAPADDRIDSPARMRRFLVLDYLASVFRAAMYAALPLIVLTTLGADANAYYYVAFSLIMALDLFGYHVATSITAEGAFTPARLRELTRAALVRFSFLLVPAVVVLVVFAPLILLFYGPEYADEGTTVLRLLALGTLVRVVLLVFMGVMRAEGRGEMTALQEGVQCVLAVGLTYVLAQAWGLTGVGLAWVLMNLAVAAVVVPVFIRFLRGAGPPAPAPPVAPADVAVERVRT